MDEKVSTDYVKAERKVWKELWILGGLDKQEK